MKTTRKMPQTGLFRSAAAAAMIAMLTVAAAAPALADETNDPLEPVNRAVFWFNDKVDVYLLEPVAKGYDFVMPDLAQTAVTNAFSNARFPLVFLNTLLQGKPIAAAESTGRFIINSTVGVGGLGDPATGLNFPRYDEDFGQTLGWWGAGSGPYLVLPFVGPSNVRDGLGLIVDSASRVWPYYVNDTESLAITAGLAVNTRANYLDEIEDAKASAVDYYSAARNAFHQSRVTKIADGEESEGEGDEDDLYFFDYAGE